MKKLIYGMVMFAVTGLLASSSAHAEITFSFNDVTTTAGSSVTVLVLATGDDQVVTGFNLPFDVGNDGLGIPSGLTLDGFSSPLFPGVGSSLGPVAGTADGVANSLDLTATGVTFGSTPIVVFGLDFSVDASVAPGTVFELSLLNQAPIDVTGVGGASIIGEVQALNPGSITVAIPEPSSFVLAVLALGGLAAQRRRRL